MGSPSKVTMSPGEGLQRLAVDRDAARLDQPFGLAARGDPGMGQHLGDALAALVGGGLGGVRFIAHA
jgi:hypothetical protein